MEEANRWFDFANRCFDGSKDQEYNMKMAKEYWAYDAKSDADQNPVVEVLVDGNIKVLEIVKWGQTPFGG